jgi:hypothetical protein
MAESDTQITVVNNSYKIRPHGMLYEIYCEKYPIPEGLTGLFTSIPEAEWQIRNFLMEKHEKVVGKK